MHADWIPLLDSRPADPVTGADSLAPDINLLIKKNTKLVASHPHLLNDRELISTIALVIGFKIKSTSIQNYGIWNALKNISSLYHSSNTINNRSPEACPGIYIDDY